MFGFVSQSPEQTMSLGERLAVMLQSGDFISLHGELGAGKTRFAQGVAYGLGVSREAPVTSPTYTLLNIYPARIPLYHFDLYRLTSDSDAYDAGFDEYFYGDGVSLVEWPERLVNLLPEDRLEIFFTYLDDHTRRIDFHPCGEKFIQIMATLTAPPENFIITADLF
jgi:tRNA threonylcarbamoyladenosine biosynthesis protein TsaE